MKLLLNKNELIKRLEIKKKSQNWLALRINTSSGYMSQLINGHRNISTSMRSKISDVMGTANQEDLFMIIN